MDYIGLTARITRLDKNSISRPNFKKVIDQDSRNLILTDQAYHGRDYTPLNETVLSGHSWRKELR